jgi:phenylacetate-CoA ligase
VDIDVAERSVGGISFEQISNMMRESPQWSPQHMLLYQRTQLAQLLRHAQSQTQFYKDRLRAVLRADGSINWSKWSQVPIVKRTDLRDRAAEMHAHILPVNHGTINTISSSGSTGVPISIRFSALSTHVARAAWARFFDLHGLDMTVGHTVFKVTLSDGQPMTDRVKLPPKGQAGAATSINRTLDTREKLLLLRETNTSVIADVPNHIEILAHENLRTANPLKLKFIIGYGMKTTPEQEALFKRSFGATTLMPYSSEESNLMAFQCPVDRRNYHVCSELAYFEVLNAQDQPCEIGEKGRVIITPFYNAAQPFIRYEQGDEVVRGPPCICGSKLPVLSEISGRIDAIFRFPTKSAAVAGLDYRLIQLMLKADAFQFAQVAPMEIIVRYVSQHEADTEKCDIVRSLLFAVIGCEPEVIFQRVEEIPTNAGGKQQRITREFDLV